MKSKILFVFITTLFIGNSEISYSQDNLKNKTFSIQDTTLADENISKGKTFYTEAKYDSSYFYYSKAKNIYEELVKQYDQESILVSLIRCSNMLGWILKIQGKYEASIDEFLYAVEIGIKNLGENNSLVAATYNNIGAVYGNKSDFDKALEYYFKSLSIIGENPMAAAGYNNIGIIFLDKGDFDRALEYFQKAVSIRRQVKEEEDIEIAQYYNNIGLVYKSIGDYDKALEYFRKSLSINMHILGEEHILIANKYNNMGTIYSHKGEYDEAIKNYEKSLSLRIKLLGENHQDVAGSYINIGIIYLKKGDHEKALEILQKSLANLLQLFNEDNNMVAQNYMYIGNAYRDKGDYGQSLENLEKSLSMRIRLFGEKNPDVAESYLNIAKVFERKFDYAAALNYCQKSIISLVSKFDNPSINDNPSLSAISSESYLLEALKLKAKIFSNIADSNNDLLAKTNLEVSLSTSRLAAELIDKMFTGYKSQGSKLFLGERTSEVYNLGIETTLNLFTVTKDKRYYEQAFVFSERGKSAVLQKELNEIEAKHFGNIPDELLNEERQLRVDLAFYETQLQNEYQKKDLVDSVKISDYEDHLFTLKNNYNELISGFEKNYPDYYELKYQINNVSILEIQKELPNNSALLEYFVGDNTIYIFSILKDNFDIAAVKKPNNFSGLIKDFYSSILKTEKEKYINAGNELTSLLITPIFDKLGTIENLIIIPHDILYKIPFEALFTSKQKNSPEDYNTFKYLIKTFDISYHYSSTLYINSLQKRSVMFSEKDGKSLEKNFIGFAPVFSSKDTKGYTLATENASIFASNSDELFRSAIISGERFDELKYSEWEVKSIIELFSANKNEKTSRTYFYSDAIEETFKSNIKLYNIIHIASHSFINELHPEISGIVFAQPTDTNANDDGILYAEETYNLDLNADLVTLSSCESGLGKLVKGEGMMALTRGFLYSGAANILFSLWKIPDKQTSELMIEFYRQMLSGKNYSKSLRQAKLSMIRNNSSARPRSWASFILVGSN